jgi:hypothetical protein
MLHCVLTHLASLSAGILIGIAPADARAAAGPGGSDPSGQQIRQAVRHAQRSREVWATVNICNTRRYPHTIGIRGQLPALGFPARLYMSIQVDYWVKAKRRFVPDSNAKQSLSLGRQSSGRHQAGFTWRFAPPAFLSGTVTFEWKLGRKVIGRTTRRTVHGIKNVDDSDPKGYSTATCRILK